MTVNLNFNLEAWIKNLEISADSEEAAIEKLKNMSLSDILEEGGVVDSEMSFTEIEASVVDYDLEIEVTDIVYAPDPETMGGMSVIEYLKNLLPKRQIINLRGVTDDDNVEELIKDYILDETGYDTESFEFQILKKKQFI